ncbi:MAG: hypothetical protein ACXAC8_13040 [Candidatus Hodarchaeales archaeon]|jgi:hypothetical protein
MIREKISYQNIRKLLQFKQLKMFVKEINNETNESQEHILSAIWCSMKNMQSELELHHLSLNELIDHFIQLEEIRKVLKLQTISFSQLNELYYEIRAIKKAQDIPEDLSFTEVLLKIKNNPEKLPTFAFLHYIFSK